MKKVRKALGSVRSLTRGQTDRDGNHASFALTSSASRPASPQDGSYIRFDDQEPTASYGDPLKMKDPSSTKLHRWAFLGDISKIKKSLLKTDVNCEDGDRRTPLHMSAYGGHVEAVCFLLSSGADVEAVDKEGRTPLLRAVERGHIPATQTLLQHKANALAKDLHDTTALHLAARTTSPDLLDLLLSLGLDYELPDIRGQTPLHVASAALDMDIVKVLLAYRANANAADKEGVTPLMIAAKQGCNSLVEVFLQAGALLQHVDCSGWSALSYAKYSGHMELHTYLESLLKKELVTRRHLKSSGMLGLSFNEADDLKDGNETSEGADDCKVHDSNSWNDDSSENNEMASKPTISLSRFMSISNRSLKSSASSNSPKSLLSNPSIAAPTKPPRSPKRIIRNEDGTSLKEERSDTIETPLNRVKIQDLSTKEDSVEDDPNSAMLCESKTTDHSYDDVSFNDNSNDDFLPSDRGSLSPGLPQFSSNFKVEEKSSKVSTAREESSNSDSSGAIHSNINEPKNSLSETKESSPILEDVHKTKTNIDPDSYLDDSEQNEFEIDEKCIEERETKFERNSSLKPKSTSVNEEELDGEQIFPFNEPEIVTDAANEGTLGRIDTLQMREEIWEANAHFTHTESGSLSTDSSDSSAKLEFSKHSTKDLAADVGRIISIDYKENPVDGTHEQETSPTHPMQDTEISAEEFNLSITKPKTKTSQVLKKDASVVLTEATDNKRVIPKKSNSEVSAESSEISEAVIKQNYFDSVICNTEEMEGGKLLTTDNLNTSNCEKGDLNTDIPNNDNSTTNKNTALDLNLSVINDVNIDNQNAEDLNLDIFNNDNLTCDFHGKLELKTDFSKSSDFETSIEIKDNISTDVRNEDDLHTNVHNSTNSSPDGNQNKESKRTNSNDLDTRNFRDNFDPKKKSLHPIEELISSSKSFINEDKEYQNSSILPENDKGELSSSSSNSKSESNLNLDIDSLENLDRLDLNKVKEILKNLTIKLKREKTMKETCEIQVQEYKHLENSLNEKIMEQERSLSPYKTDIAASKSNEENPEFDLFRPVDGASFASIEHKETQVNALDLDDLNLKLEYDLKGDGIITIENNLEVKNDRRTPTTGKLKSLSTVPTKKESGTQSEEKCFSSTDTQTSPEVNNAERLNVKNVSTTTENLWNLTEAGIQTEVINLYDNITNDSVEPNAEKQNIVHSTTQTPSSFFERLCKDSQTDGESIMDDTEEIHKISRAASEQDLSVACRSSETQTIFFLSDRAAQTDCDDSGVEEDVKEMFDRSTQVTQTTEDESCQTNNVVVDSCSQVSVEKGLLPMENAFTQTDNVFELTNLTDVSGLIRCIVGESNNCLKESLAECYEKLDQMAILLKKLSAQNDNPDSSNMANIFMELSQLRETILKTVSEANKITPDEGSSSSFMLTLESLQAKLSCWEEISKQLHNLNKNFEIILTQSSETTSFLQTNSESMNNMKQEVSQSIRDLQPKLISVGEKTGKNLGEMQQSLKLIETSVETFQNKAVNNQSQLDDLKDTLHAITERWDRQDNLVRDLMCSEKQKQDYYLNEMSSLVEQVTRDSDNQLHHNLKISLRNLDGTVGENFEIIQNLMVNLRDDMIRKLNEMALGRSKEIHGQELGIEALSSDMKTINATLSNIRKKIDFKGDELSSKSLFEPEIIEAIRGGNDQALTAIQAQGKCIMKTLETCNSMIKDLIEVGLSSELHASHLNKNEAFEKKLLLQKEHFIKDIEILERQNTVLEEYIAREKACAKEERVRRKELESELKLMKTENKTLVEEAQNLKLTNDNMKRNCQDLITKNLALQQQAEQEIRNALSLGVKTNSAVFLVNETREPCQDPSPDKTTLDLGNDLKLANTSIAALESENIKKIEQMNQEKEKYLQQIGNLKNEISTKESELTYLKQKYLYEIADSQNTEHENTTQKLDENLVKELATLKENKTIMKNELLSKNKLLNEIKERVEEMEILQRDSEMNLKIKTTKIQNLKSENWELQKKIKSLSKDFEEQMYDEKLSAFLRQRNEELEKEVFQDRSLILNLKERITFLSQEKMQLMKEISSYREEKISSDLLQKQKDEAEESLKSLVKEFAKMKTNIDEEFIPKSKLQSLYQEMENHFGALLTKKLYECQKPMIENLRSLECSNGTLKGREEVLKTEVKGLLDQIQQLKAKLNFCCHNAHLWKSKYQQLFESRYPKTFITTNPTFPMEKNHKPSDPTYKAPVKHENILEDIEAILKRPYENSAFLGSLLDPSSPLYPTNTPLDKASLLPSLSYSSVDDAPQPEVDLDKKVVLDSLEKSLQKYLPAERDDTSVSSTSLSGDVNTRKSSKYPQPPMDTLQESIDSYVNFLARSSND